MLNRFQGWRERGWSVVDAPVYSNAWQRFGGSVATHPQVIERLAGLADIPVRYLAWEQGGELQACIATWGRDLALSKDVLKQRGKKRPVRPGQRRVDPARCACSPGALAAPCTLFVGPE